MFLHDLGRRINIGQIAVSNYENYYEQEAEFRTPYTISFVDSDDPNQYIFAAQEGSVREGTTLSVTFPEQIIGSDGHIWKSLDESPKQFNVYNSGTQKFYVEYRQCEAIIRPDTNEGEEKLNKWLEMSTLVTGRTEEVTAIKGAMSDITDGEWHELYLLGENYEPQCMAAGLVYDAVYSSVILDRFSADGKEYTVVKLRYRIPVTMNEETIYSITDDRAWKKGDRVKGTIAGKEQYFTCVSEDYGNYCTGLDGQGRLALFLCDSIIPADYLKNEFEFSVLSFGANNNYKNSNVRKFLQEESEKGNWVSVPKVLTGVNTAFLGETKAFSYEQAADMDLISCDIGYQYMTDSLFSLSLEEALEVRDSLWKLGKDENNAETMRGPYAEGYYLRTPMYSCDEEGRYINGEKIYIVDLREGTIYPVSCQIGNVGVRPAFALKITEDNE